MLTLLISPCEDQARLSISAAAYESEKVNYKSPLKVSLTRLSQLLDLLGFIHHKQQLVTIVTETTGHCSLRIRGVRNTQAVQRKMSLNESEFFMTMGIIYGFSALETDFTDLVRVFI
ncbi:hypothetical protein CEXT_273931 [Caerostris extrusa]|uniref:Uncharacterized protein n=1 Tax=Caerostris extrusa TaxID=172846 RepID=A0AAV4NNF2_CAEEX|nr:hypothetical protein CEXT_273931 [Caerostris extrusa]